MISVSATDLLGTAPSVDQVDEFLLSAGYQARTVGSSVEGRDLVLYKKESRASAPTLLLLSLVHGNEPMGLLALLETVQQLNETSGEFAPNVLLLPFVNVDAYILNRDYGHGCRRTNLNSSSSCAHASPLVEACPKLSRNGVDLNRNYPISWKPSFECRHNYGGHSPWSEPESQAVRNVVLENPSIDAAISFHSLWGRGRPPLLIHPYTSDRSFYKMNPFYQYRYRRFSRAMNYDDFFITGTALEAIKYSAGGSTIDWLHSVGVLSFVVEVVPSCDSRWCDELRYSLERYGRTGGQLVDLIATDRRLPVTLVLVVAILILAIAYYYAFRRRRLKSDSKQHDTESFTELVEIENLLNV